MIGTLAFWAMPIVYMILATFKTTSQLFTIPITWLPPKPTLENYQHLFSSFPFVNWLFNSFIVSVSYTVLALFISSLAGFAFAKYEFHLKKLLFGIVLFTIMIPFQVLIIPLFRLLVLFHWVNTYHGVFLPLAANAFGIFLMRQYMLEVPSELVDAAHIDGANDFQVYWRIALPITRSALIVLAIIFFINSWNDFLWPLIVLNDNVMFTVPLGIATMVGPFSIPWGTIMTAAFLGTLPTILIFIFLQRYFVDGLTLGALKA